MGKDTGEERLANGTKTANRLSAGEQVLTTLPHAEMRMRSIRRSVREDDGRERCAQTSLMGERSREMTRENRLVARPDRITWRERDLQLTGAILRMQLRGPHSRGLKPVAQIEEVVRDQGKRSRTVTGPLMDRSKPIRAIVAHGPLELEARDNLQLMRPRLVHHPSQELPLTARPRISFLIALIDRKPCPTWRAGENPGGGEIRNESQITRGALNTGNSCEEIVGASASEHDGEPDPVRRGCFKCMIGHALHACHARVVDKHKRRSPYTRLTQLAETRIVDTSVCPRPRLGFHKVH
jgi:hypothetical protein